VQLSRPGGSHLPEIFLHSSLLFTFKGFFAIVRSWSFGYSVHVLCYDPSGLLVILCMCSAMTQSTSFACVCPSAWNCLPQSLHLELLSFSPLQLQKRLKMFLFPGPSTDAVCECCWLELHHDYLITLFGYITLLWAPHVFSSSVLIASEIQFC